MATTVPAGRAHLPLLPLVAPALLTQHLGCLPGAGSALHGPCSAQAVPRSQVPPCGPPGASGTLSVGQRYAVILQAGPDLLDFPFSDVFSTAFKNKIPAIKALANFIPRLFFPGSCGTRCLLQPRSAGSSCSTDCAHTATGVSHVDRVWGCRWGVWVGCCALTDLVVHGEDPSSLPCWGARKAEGSVCGAGSTVWCDVTMV